MLTDKHRKELGAYVFSILHIPANKETELIKLGKAVEGMYNYLLREAERDARDKANGKNK